MKKDPVSADNPLWDWETTARNRSLAHVPNGREAASVKWDAEQETAAVQAVLPLWSHDTTKTTMQIVVPGK